jgi:hypothetical protein
MHGEEEEGAQREEEDEGARVQREKKEVAVRGRGIKGAEEEAQLFFYWNKGAKIYFFISGMKGHHVFVMGRNSSSCTDLHKIADYHSKTFPTNFRQIR